MPLTKYRDALPVPAVLKPRQRSQDATFYEVHMRQVQQKLHSELPPTTVWGYAGVYPGPTFEVRRDENVRVKWINDLPPNHLLPVDTTIHGAMDTPPVRTVVHLHGADVPADSDGYPEAWFTSGWQQVGPTFTRKTYHYPNPQRATTLWYHDHAIGITRLNVYAGLAGFYLIRDDCEDRLNLPRGPFEIPIVIQDRTFNGDGSLFYPTEPDPPVPGVFPSIVPEFFGNTMLANGKVWPFLAVDPRKYRFRLLNGCNSRFLRLALSSGQPFIQIGSEGGLFRHPVTLATLTLAPAERADVLIDFRGRKGQSIVLTNDAPAPFPDGDPPDPETTGQVMQFRVTSPRSGRDTSRIPDDLCPFERLRPETADRERALTLIETTDQFGRPLLLLTGREWAFPVSEKPRLGSTEIWRLINLTTDTHPMHLHLVHFQVLERRPFDVAQYRATGDLVYTGPPVRPDANERAPKDTVRANPGEVTSIIMRFHSFTGVYPWHCHILEHEDHDMMRPYRVLKPEPQTTETQTSTQTDASTGTGTRSHRSCSHS